MSVEVRPWRMRLTLLGLLVFFAVGLAGAWFASSIWQQILLGLCAVLFGGVFLIALPTLFCSRDVPLITVAPSGIETRYIGLIPWDEIERVDYTSLAGQPALGIWTKDPFLTARRGPWWIWPLAIFNRLFGYPALSFTDRAVPIEELRAAIETRRTPTWTGNYERVTFESEQQGADSVRS